MKKYYVILNILTDKYCGAMCNTFDRPIQSSGKWASEEDAVKWVSNFSALDKATNPYVTVLPIYC